MTNYDRLKAFSPTLFREAAVKAGDVAALEAAELEQCEELDCQISGFGGHNINCPSFRYRLAIQQAKEVQGATQ